ncbi:MAG TPA: hypothetical protein VH478_01540 [Trebonia sp.]|nr:hypothetical protein [Trebonia sp.]
MGGSNSPGWGNPPGGGHNGNWAGRDYYQAGRDIYVQPSPDPGFFRRRLGIVVITAALIVAVAVVVGWRLRSGAATGDGSVPPVTATDSPPAGTPLSSVNPLPSSNIYEYTPGKPQQIGSVLYPNSIRFGCSSSLSVLYKYNSVFYNVAGFASLTVTVGVPANAANAASGAANISFWKNGTTQLDRTVQVWQGSPRTVTVPLSGASQLEVYCTSTSVGIPGDSGDNIDVALGGAVLAKS